MNINQLPTFSSINPEIFPDELSTLLDSNLQTINELLKNTTYTWKNLIEPLESLENRLERKWAPFSHLHSVVNTPALRKSYEACLPKLTAYETAIGQNQKLYKAIQSLDKAGLSDVQSKIIDDSLRSFVLAGVALPEEKKKRFEAIQNELATLTHQYENNVLDATQSFFLPIEDEKQLQGLPQFVIDQAAQLAKEKNRQGWVLNLEFPTYLATVTYSEDRSLRKAMYEAYITKASDAGPQAGEFDNSKIMNQIIALRHEEAELLGFQNFAELSLATKMAESPKQVIEFLQDLAKRGKDQAQKEFAVLKEFAAEEYGSVDLEPWDIAYLSEKKKQKLYTLKEEDLRAYFPLDKVMQGLFSIVEKIYGMKMKQVSYPDTWHPEVTCYQVIDKDNQIRGYIYADLFARPQKRGGAWMDSLRSRVYTENTIQIPMATLNCNFAKPAANKSPTLSHEEVQTLFHECGHCLHHILTKAEYISVSGIHGIEWDAVELPSQFFENWCWDKDALQLLTAHEDTGESLPDEMFQNLFAAKNFQSALGMMRQLELALFDFRMHKEYQNQEEFIATILEDVRQQTRLLPTCSFNRFQHSFTHIFSSGYAAGYYSYKWAEVLSSDAFSRFEEEGVFNQKTGLDFLSEILEQGSSRKALDSFVAFRGRKPEIDALLRHNGIQG
jgi:oligopeptidase A